jgi:hypothetical protein
MPEFEYKLVDHDGDAVQIESAYSMPKTAFVFTLGGAYIPAAKVPEFCTAVFLAAGLEAPDFTDPNIELLARQIAVAFHDEAEYWNLYADQAEQLLALGWKL